MAPTCFYLHSLAIFISFLRTSKAYSGTTNCSSIPIPTVPGANVLSINSAVLPDTPSAGASVCDYNVTINHDGTSDSVLIELWLPLSAEQWNGRFQATGGGGYLVGLNTSGLLFGTIQGYVAGRTDGGHGFDTSGYEDPSSWALLPDGSVDDVALLNYASRSIHDLAVVGKAVTSSFYGNGTKVFSYFNGCSNGGREGYVAAQQYPDDFDGIVAGAPAINFPELLVADLWGQVVMRAKGLVSACILDAFLAEEIRVCDGLDGVTDGVIANVEGCLQAFNPYSLVRHNVTCGDGTVLVTQADADVVAKIHEGPRTAAGQQLWYGILPGSDFSVLDGTSISSNGALIGAPFLLVANWVAYWLRQDPSYNVSAIDYITFYALFNDSVSRYSKILGGNNPDLSSFRANGGKLLSWQGLADQIIPPNGTVNYRQRVERVMGGNEAVNDFYRLFFAPGMGHCGLGGSGPAPVDPLGALVDWVEKGQVPATLPAISSDGQWARNLCSWPLVEKWDGVGDPKLSGSYSCADSFYHPMSESLTGAKPIWAA